LPIGKVLETYNDPIDALNHFYQQYSGTYYLQKEKDEALKALLKKQAQTQSYISKSMQKLEELKTNSRHEEIANIIMANLHSIPQQAEEIELYDFYNNNQVKIKLKKDASPQKNAENLYRKAKNQKLELKQLEENILAKKALNESIVSQIKEVQETNNLKQLRRHVKNYNLVKESFKQEESLPYKEVYFDGYTILIGKSAKNNDLLIQHHAHKDDLWLHAKDVAGSHVIVKQKPGQNFPKNVIEKAAGIAAFHSKMKNDSICPVIYTPRKFIRKVKGTAPGAVRVERESVILVPPSL
jgi:predicted ribosome quality control (RQC) complex YloA/Tae2 family protein